MKKLLLILLVSALCLTGCKSKSPAEPAETKKGTFGADQKFLSEHVKTITLSNGQGAMAVIVPAYQGRIMTSTADGLNGKSFGWINHDLISSGKFVEHINVFGGEDRFWIGPEGGQFSIFFKNNDPFDLDHWYTPAFMDTEAFELVSATKTKAVFTKQTELTNFSNTHFKIKIDRTVSLLNSTQLRDMGIEVNSNVKAVACKSENTLTNIGTQAWKKETGLLSIWILGMFNPSPETTIVIPFRQGDEEQFGKIVTDDYFGKVPESRLIVKDNVLFFKGDGQYRSKIGLSPKRAKPFFGSYDAKSGALTIVHVSLPESAIDYVNSLWKMQDKPFDGDAINSYNDGPAKPGAKPLGPFYELESSSPAVALQPNQSITHTHTTVHITGTEQELDHISKTMLGVGLDEIKNAFGK